MEKEYQDWCYLNEEGMEKYGDIFPDRQLPIVSMITITFEHPKLENPEKAYLLKGKDLTEEQLEKLIDKTSKKFDDGNKDQIRNAILNNEIPIREKITSGAGTKRIFMYLPDHGYGLDDWEEEEEDETP